MAHALLNEQVRAFMAQKEAAGLIPSGAGIAVSVVTDESTLFSGTYGLRERDKNLPVTSDTLFEICSLAKLFTSTALMMASEKGKVDLDRPLNASKNRLTLKDAEVSQKVSLADLLSHRTGMPSNDLLWYFSSFSRDDIFRAIAELELARGAFRRTFTYNNLMYGVLGHLFEDLVGQSWEKELTEKILKPLKMSSTYFRHPSGEQNVALPYVGIRRVERADMSTVSAAGAIVSSLNDMSKWMAFHLGRGAASDGSQLLSDSSFVKMQTAQVPLENLNSLIFQGLEWIEGAVGYGFGWFTGSVKGQKILFHPGFIDGFSTAMVMIPERRLGFLVMTNLNLNPVPGLLIQDLLVALLESENVKHQPAVGVVAPRLNPDVLIGEYKCPAYRPLSIRAKGSELVLDYHGTEWPLKWKTETTAEFVVTAFGIQIPLPLQFESEHGKATQLSIPFSMDPRVALQVFTRAV